MRFLKVLITLQKMFQKDQKKKKISCGGDLNNRQTERTPQKCLRCGSEYHLITNFPKPPKENEKHREQVSLN